MKNLKELGITPSEIDQLEQRLGIELPQDYRIALIKDITQGTRYFQHDDVGPFIVDTNWIVKEYEYNLKESYYGRNWPKKVIPIGTDGGGGLYAIKSECDSPKVYYIDWETINEDIENEMEIYADDFSGFRKKIFQLERDTA